MRVSVNSTRWLYSHHSTFADFCETSKPTSATSASEVAHLHISVFLWRGIQHRLRKNMFCQRYTFPRLLQFKVVYVVCPFVIWYLACRNTGAYLSYTICYQRPNAALIRVLSIYFSELWIAVQLVAPCWGATTILTASLATITLLLDDPSLLIGIIHCVKCYSGTKRENGSVVRNST